MSSDFEKRVTAIQGNPISTETPISGQYLGWDGSRWTPTNLPTFPSSLPPIGTAYGDLSGEYPAPVVFQLTGTVTGSYPTAISTIGIVDPNNVTTTPWANIITDNSGTSYSGIQLSNVLGSGSSQNQFFIFGTQPYHNIGLAASNGNGILTNASNVEITAQAGTLLIIDGLIQFVGNQSSSPTNTTTPNHWMQIKDGYNMDAWIPIYR